MGHYVDQMPFPVVLRLEVPTVDALNMLELFLGHYRAVTQTEVLGQSKDGWVKFPDGEVVEQMEVINGNDQ